MMFDEMPHSKGQPAAEFLCMDSRKEEEAPN